MTRNLTKRIVCRLTTPRVNAPAKLQYRDQYRNRNRHSWIVMHKELRNFSEIPNAMSLCIHKPSRESKLQSSQFLYVDSLEVLSSRLNVKVFLFRSVCACVLSDRIKYFRSRIEKGKQRHGATELSDTGCIPK